MPPSKDKVRNRVTRRTSPVTHGIIVAFCCLLIVAIISFLGLLFFDTTYRGRVYPSVSVAGVPFGGQSPRDVEAYWLSRNEPFQKTAFTLSFSEHVATVSGFELDLGYDATLSATQAYLVGRSGHMLSDFLAKFLTPRNNLTPYFRWNDQVFADAVETLSDRIDIPVQDALFQFDKGRVTAFRPSREGRRVNKDETKKRFREALSLISDTSDRNLTITVPVETLKPTFTTDRVNSFGIKELIGRGYSEFVGSIPGRIHNITLAAARINGILIKPGEIFSFNQALGDVSATTGFQPAYIIKEGRTVLGDGGGVCQVSTTLFRAALNAGLPIIERRAHAYRVHYYEEGGFKPGIDATVFDPTVDLKIKNDTPGFILIQTKIDAARMTLTIDLYGAGDGRKAEIFNHQLWGLTPPPPDLYQDDPTLPKGVVKQVDFAAWGAKTSFQYRVTRGGEVLQDTTFYSNFRPWQAVYLRGPGG